MLLLRPGRWLQGTEGPFDRNQAVLVVGLQSLLIFGERGEVDWSIGAPLALGSAAGAYIVARLASSDRTKAWVYRFLIVVVVLLIIDLIIVDSTKYLQHT